MKKYILYTAIFALNSALQAQSFAPAAGEAGTTAIYKDSSVFVAWATQVELMRGYLDITDKSLGLASFGTANQALGMAEGNSVDVVSLGDSGVVIFQFDRPITDESGPDFAVFENGFTDDYLELAFVEVSSDGVNYQRFQAVSETPLTAQLGPFEFSDCRYVHNLAGKYRQGYGTPFDLADLPDGFVDKSSITHIKIIDVIGTINPDYASRDANDSIINDPYPTAFEAGGFDLDALGVIHQAPLGVSSLASEIKIFPNPMSDYLNVQSDLPLSFTIRDLLGKVLLKTEFGQSFKLEVSHLPPGIYLLEIKSEKETSVSLVEKM